MLIVEKVFFLFYWSKVWSEFDLCNIYDLNSLIKIKELFICIFFGDVVNLEFIKERWLIYLFFLK